MSVDHIRYDLLTQDALRGLIRRVLADAAVKGLPGEHHFFITFDTRADGVRMSSRLKASYPAEMGIVLQHQFWDLTVGDEGFDVGLSFNGIPERLHVPFSAVKSFVDPSVQFGLQFATEAEAADREAPGDAKGKAGTEPPTAAERNTAPAGRPNQPAFRPEAKPSPTVAEDAKADGPAGPRRVETTGEVVKFDRFRKK
jgi:hypothetical protein